MRIAVATAFTTGYDNLRPSTAAEFTNVDYLAWVDVDDVSRVPAPWRPRRLPTISRVGKRRCLYVKTHLNDLVGDHDAIVWVDARLMLTTPATTIVERYLTEGIDLVTFRHPRNADLHSEIEEIRREALISDTELDVFTAALSDEALYRPPHSETNCIIIRNNDATRQFGLDWWATIETAPARDQLTFDHVLASSGIAWCHFDAGVTSAADCDFLDKGQHLNKRTSRSKPERQGLNKPTLWARPSSSTTESRHVDGASVIVPVHSGYDHVSACLDSIFESDFAGELIIVDNGSDEATARLCRATTQRNDTKITVRLEQTRDALGFGRAANLGASLATTDIIIIINSDTTMPNTWAKSAINSFDDPANFAVGFVSNQAGDLSVGSDAFEALIAAGWDIRDLTQLCADFARGWSKGLEPEMLRSVHGSAVAFRREVFDELGGFDTSAFPNGYGEEVDLCLRAIRAGFVNRVDTTVFYHHIGNATYGPRRDELNRQGKIMLRQRHPSRLLDVISDDLRHTPTVWALNHDLSAYLRRLGNEEANQ